MKPIRAPSEPPCFAAWRAANPTGTWDTFVVENRDAPDGTRRCKRELLEELLSAQHHLCAYCEIELDPPLWAEVEHWHPKDPTLYPGHNWGLDFANLMAGCEGGTKVKEDGARSRASRDPKSRHCGAAKGNLDLTATLLDPRRDLPATPVWAFDGQGGIHVAGHLASTLADRAHATVAGLNLDSAVLRQLRATVWHTLTEDVASAAQALGGTPEAWAQALDFVAAEKLAVRPDGTLHRFWSTIRSFFAEYAERWLQRHPELVT